MCVCACGVLCVRVCVRVCARACVCACVCVRACVCARMQACVYACIHACIRLLTCVHVKHWSQAASDIMQFHDGFLLYADVMHYHGNVRNVSTSWAAVSLCQGLKWVLLVTMYQNFFIPTHCAFQWTQVTLPSLLCFVICWTILQNAVHGLLSSKVKPTSDIFNATISTNKAVLSGTLGSSGASLWWLWLDLIATALAMFILYYGFVNLFC